MIDYQQLFHTGVVVADLDEAMADLGDSLGVGWADPMTVAAQRVWTPAGGEDTWPVRFTYSTEGPQHVELVEGPAGSLWDGAVNAGVHHVGVWVDDVAAEAERLIGLGWTTPMAQRSPENGFGSFVYLQPASGTIVELVSVAAKPRFEAWWAGGAFA